MRHRILFIILALLASAGIAQAQTEGNYLFLSVGDAGYIRKGTGQVVYLMMADSHTDADPYYRSFQCDLHLPEGVEIEEADGDLHVESLIPDATTKQYVVSITRHDGTAPFYRVIAYSLRKQAGIALHADGQTEPQPVLKLYVTVPVSVTSEADWQVDNQVLGINGDRNDEAEAQTQALDVRRRLVVLDENATTRFPLVEQGEHVDVELHRTFKKGEWNTLWLPFSIGREQFQELFGEDCPVYETKSGGKQDDGTMQLNFGPKFDSPSTEPNLYVKESYSLIRPTKDVPADMKFEDVEFRDIHESYTYWFKYIHLKPLLCVATSLVYYGNEQNDYYAGYNMGVKINNIIFLSGDKFYTTVASTSKVKMKAFRFYWFGEEIDEAVAQGGTSNVKFFVNDIATDIADLEPSDAQQPATGSVYNLSGQYLGRDLPRHQLPKGIYIIDGRKVIIK